MSINASETSPNFSVNTDENLERLTEANQTAADIRKDIVQSVASSSFLAQFSTQELDKLLDDDSDVDSAVRLVPRVPDEIESTNGIFDAGEDPNLKSRLPIHPPIPLPRSPNPLEETPILAAVLNTDPIFQASPNLASSDSPVVKSEIVLPPIPILKVKVKPILAKPSPNLSSLSPQVFSTETGSENPTRLGYDSVPIVGDMSTTDSSNFLPQFPLPAGDYGMNSVVVGNTPPAVDPRSSIRKDARVGDSLPQFPLPAGDYEMNSVVVGNMPPAVDPRSSFRKVERVGETKDTVISLGKRKSPVVDAGETSSIKDRLRSAAPSLKEGDSQIGGVVDTDPEIIKKKISGILVGRVKEIPILIDSDSEDTPIPKFKSLTPVSSPKSPLLHLRMAYAATLDRVWAKPWSTSPLPGVPLCCYGKFVEGDSKREHRLCRGLPLPLDATLALFIVDSAQYRGNGNLWISGYFPIPTNITVSWLADPSPERYLVREFKVTSRENNLVEFPVPNLTDSPPSFTEDNPGFDMPLEQIFFIASGQISKIRLDDRPPTLLDPLINPSSIGLGSKPILSASFSAAAGPRTSKPASSSLSSTAPLPVIFPSLAPPSLTTGQEPSPPLGMLPLAMSRERLADLKKVPDRREWNHHRDDHYRRDYHSDYHHRDHHHHHYRSHHYGHHHRDRSEDSDHHHHYHHHKSDGKSTSRERVGSPEGRTGPDPFPISTEDLALLRSQPTELEEDISPPGFVELPKTENKKRHSKRDSNKRRRANEGDGEDDAPPHEGGGGEGGGGRWRSGW
jgi:hypothetical protein